MKWIVGYQLTESDEFMNEILRRKEQIREIYFSWGTMPNGRHASVAHESLTESEARRRTEEDLKTLSGAGLAMNLLLNGNCYGRRSLSKSFLLEVCDAAEEIGARFGLASVTTTSPVLAHLIKSNFPQLEVRASVNMEIGTAEGMEYLAPDFDSFYLKRELNRSLPELSRLSRWCAAHGRKCFLLANSGCLNNCSARQFHDNLVAHEREIAEMDNGVVFRGICGPYLRRETDRGVYLRRLNFIRPEDIPLYEGIVPAVKLATRVSRSPARVLRAYAEGKYSGNLLDLLEPDHAETLYPWVLENSRLPAGFGKTVSSCGQKCESGGTCAYCREAAERALVKLPEGPAEERKENGETRAESERGVCRC